MTYYLVDRLHVQLGKGWFGSRFGEARWFLALGVVLGTLHYILVNTELSETDWQTGGKVVNRS